ncbi:11045_t:CDS:2, partial [Scutellospora calospora]
MSSWLMAITYVGGMLIVMSTFSFIWRRRKAATTKYIPWFPEHTTRDIYISLLQQTSPPATELQLKAALLRRAMTDVERILRLKEDRPALASLVQKGSVGDDLWISFLKAEQELQQDIMEVAAEADTFKEDWEIEHEKKEIARLEKERKKAEEELLKMEE